MGFKANNLEEIKEAIQAGADVNAKYYNGCRTLDYTDSIEIARILIENGADVNAECSNINEKNLLLRWTKSIEIVKLLIAKGANVNAKDDMKKTPLHKTNSIEMAKLLIENKADVNAKDFLGATPLHVTRSDEIAKLLIENGADVNAKNKYAKTPLHVTESVEIAKLLIAKGANINAKTEYGETPLHVTESEEIAKLLIAKGANVNTKNNFGETPLQVQLSHAGYKDNTGIVRLLGASKADISTADAARQKWDEKQKITNGIECIESCIRQNRSDCIFHRYGQPCGQMGSCTEECKKVWGSEAEENYWKKINKCEQSCIDKWATGLLSCPSSTNDYINWKNCHDCRSKCYN